MRLILLLLSVIAISGLAGAAFIAASLGPWPPTSPASAQAWTQLLQFLVAVCSAAVAGIGLYYTFFTSFSPRLSIGATMWRIRPMGSSNTPIEIAALLTIMNEGARPGFVEDLAVRLHFPSGEWFLSPVAIIDSGKYYDLIASPSDSPKLPVIEFFSPLAVGGKSSVTKFVMFSPFGNDADRNIMEAGVYHLHFYFRHSKSDSFHDLGTRKLVLESDVLEDWKNGTTIVGVVLERPTDPRPLIRAMDPDGGAR